MPDGRQGYEGRQADALGVGAGVVGAGVVGAGVVGAGVVGAGVVGSGTGVGDLGCVGAGAGGEECDGDPVVGDFAWPGDAAGSSPIRFSGSAPGRGGTTWWRTWDRGIAGAASSGELTEVLAAEELWQARTATDARGAAGVDASR